MPKKHIVKQLRTTLNAKEAAEIVLNVHHYKDFIPYCTHSKILERSDGNFTAEITISFAIFKVSYISEIKYRGDENFFEIDVTESHSSHNKIFKHLLNTWKFKKSGEVMEVNFSVDFEIKNKILNGLAGKSINIASEVILRAFLQRIQK
jgi:coenzyme Q-binding protein COQ10